MFPPEFDYREADTVAEAVDLLAAHDDAAVLSGGHSLLPAMKRGDAAPSTVVDVSDVDAVHGVEATEEGVRVGATTRYVEAAASATLSERASVLAEAAGAVGDVQIRNRGTVGGNLAASDRGADLPAAALAAAATLHLRGPDGERTVDADDFFDPGGGTAVGDDEVLTALWVPDASDAGHAYVRRTHPATGYALVGVAALVRTDGGAVTDARLAANGVCERGVRLPATEAELADAPADGGTIERAAEVAGDGVDDEFVGDPTASGEFRAHLLSTQVAAALETALSATGGTA
jgi:carbon-monoxide dehydrogenase medium subunit